METCLQTLENPVASQAPVVSPAKGSKATVSFPPRLCPKAIGKKQAGWVMVREKCSHKQKSLAFVVIYNPSGPFLEFLSSVSDFFI